MLQERRALAGSIFEAATYRGRLIAVVGFDGSGKTTQLDRLAACLRANGEDVVVTRQPTDWYRNDPFVRGFLDSGAGSEQVKALALFAAADRMRHLQEVVRPALHAGKTVLCDRYVFASLALFEYRGVSLQFLADINRGVPRPDLALYLSVPPDLLLRRLRQRDGEKLKFEERSVAVVQAMIAHYAIFDAHLVTIPAAGAIDDIHRAIVGACRPMFPSIVPLEQYT